MWSDDDLKVTRELIRNPSSLISRTWSEDPTKLAIIRALVSCQAKLRSGHVAFDVTILNALAQKDVCFLHSYSLEVEGVHY